MKDQLGENRFDGQELPPFDFDEEDCVSSRTNKQDKQAYIMRRSIEGRLEEKRLQDLIKDWDYKDDNC